MLFLLLITPMTIFLNKHSQQSPRKISSVIYCSLCHLIALSHGFPLQASAVLDIFIFKTYFCSGTLSLCGSIWIRKSGRFREAWVSLGWTEFPYHQGMPLPRHFTEMPEEVSSLWILPVNCKRRGYEDKPRQFPVWNQTLFPLKVKRRKPSLRRGLLYVKNCKCLDRTGRWLREQDACHASVRTRVPILNTHGKQSRCSNCWEPWHLGSLDRTSSRQAGCLD